MNTMARHSPVREIIASAAARYARITPKGIRLPCAGNDYNPIDVALITYKPARTRYVNRHPLCRSLNGINALDTNVRCATCRDRTTCTPQIALDFSYRNVPFRLMLAYTAAKNFMAFTRTLRPPHNTIDDASVRISVIDRGRWGEPNFTLMPIQ